MKKLLLSCSFAAAACLATAGPSSAVTIPTDGTWIQADEFFTAPNKFSTTWEFSCPASGCRLDVSDFAVISDLFEVFDGLVSLGLTSIVPSWNLIGCPGPNDPSCYTLDADAAWADPRYSKMSFTLGGGDHVISILTTFIPPTNQLEIPFPDSTVQLRVTAVPVPASFLLLATGLAGTGYLARRRKANHSRLAG